MNRMPISEKHLAANRANAAKSTGPLTIQGKINTSRNAITHGILANSVLIQGESRERFAALVNSLSMANSTEHTHVERMAVTQWRMTRLSRHGSAGSHAAARFTRAQTKPPIR